MHITADRRILVTDEGKAVEATDERGTFLLVGEGCQIDETKLAEAGASFDGTKIIIGNDPGDEQPEDKPAKKGK
jgi:hypothetical protein